MQSVRKRGTDRYGRSFTDVARLAVWQRGEIVPGYNPRYVRRDACGAWIEWLKYGDTTPGGTGWEIDHIKPIAKGGGDELSNLQPLQWENNRQKGDDWPRWSCYWKRAA
jgi:5-methylcytosine-specific restriction endonuclease McrA